MSPLWKWFVYYALIIISQRSCLGLQRGCPPQEDILPCRCLTRAGEVQIWCTHSNLLKVLEGLRKVGNYIREPIDEVILENNQLPSLPGRAFAPLKIMRLMLRYNGLERVSSSWLNGLESSLMELFVVEPALRSLPEDSLSGLIALEAITVHSNLMKRLPKFSDLLKLRHLRIESASLVELSSRHFRVLPSLETVHVIGSPRLTRLEGGLLQDLPNLHLVNISFCGINWIHPRALTHLPSLTELWLIGNKIVDAAIVGRSIKDLTNLEFLHLDYNYVESLGEGSFVDLPSLRKLFMSNNQIKELHHGAFHRVPKLQTLDLNKNQVRRVHPESFLQHSGSGLEELWMIENNITHVAELRSLLDALPRLIFLDLSYNKLEFIPVGALRGHATLERLHLDHNRIHTIDRESFMAMPALRELRMRNNSLSSILETPFWNLPGLKGLDLSQNYFKSLPPRLLANLPNLRRIDLSDNQLSVINSDSFLPTPALEYVNISYNRLTTIDPSTFRHLLGLFELDSSYNRLLEFIPGLPPAIEYLYVSKNTIKKLPPPASPDLHLPALKTLDISYNGIERIPPKTFDVLHQLKKLYVGKNSLEELEDDSLEGLSHLEVLDLQDNKIARLRTSPFKHLPELREIYLSENELSVLRGDLFHATPHAKKLDLSKNQLSEISHSLLEDANDLQVVNASYNLLSDFPDALHQKKHLRVVDLTSNRIKSINSTTLQSLAALQEFRMSRNSLRSVKTKTFTNLPALKSIYLDNNELDSIESYSIDSLPWLVTIKLNSNKLKRIPNVAFHNLPTLQVVELQQNELESVAENGFSSIPRLLMLNLSHNHFTSLENLGLQNLRSLEMLDVSDNRISRVTNEDFKKMEWLVELRLDNNNICHVQGTSFNEMPRLRVLSLKNNKMRSFSEQAVRNLRGNLAVLDINGNPLVCSCQILWFRAWLEESATLGPKCNDGSLLREMRLSHEDCDREYREPQVNFPECESDFLYDAHPTHLQGNQVPPPPPPEESEYFYDEFVDYPYNETSLMTSSKNQTEEVIQSSHYTPGDTPTIYAASAKNKSKVGSADKVSAVTQSTSGFTFFGVPLPSFNLNNFWSRGKGRKAEIVKLPATLVAERKSAIVNKVPQSYRNFYPPKMPEIEKGGFVPILSGMGGFRPIPNPHLTDNDNNDLIHAAAVTERSVEVLSDSTPPEVDIGSSIVINTVTPFSSSQEPAKLSTTTSAPPTPRTAEGTTVFDRIEPFSLEEIESITTKFEDRKRQISEATLEKLIQSEESEESTPTAPSKVNASSSADRFEDIFKVYVENVSFASTTTVSHNPLAIISKNDSGSDLLGRAGHQSHYRPHGRSTITRVQHPHVSGTSPLLSDDQFTFVNAREPKTSRLDGGGLPTKLISKSKDMSWYYINYNKTNLEPYIGPGGAANANYGGSFREMNKLTAILHFSLMLILYLL